MNIEIKSFKSNDATGLDFEFKLGTNTAFLCNFTKKDWEQSKNFILAEIAKGNNVVILHEEVI